MNYKEISKEAQQILDKFKEMRELEKEQDKIKKESDKKIEELKEIRIRICRIQNEMDEIINSKTMRF